MSNMTKKIINKVTNRTPFKLSTVALLSTITFSLHGPVHAFEAKEAVTVKAGNGMSFQVGSKKAITYFNENSGHCDVTIMLSELNPVIGNTYKSASKVKVQLVPGKSTLVQSADGKALKVSCNRDAKTMTIENQKVELSALTQ